MIPWRASVLSFSALMDLGPLLLSADPAWVWSRDGSRILWANPAGGARLGAADFAALAARRWPPRHALRRDIENLVRTVPEGGTLARLRLADDPRAVPVGCRCRRIRAGDERGLLVTAPMTAFNGRAALPTVAALAAFFSSDDVNACILDEADGILVQGAPHLADAVAAGDACAEFSDSGRRLRLFLTERSIPAEEPEPQPPFEDSASPMDNAGLSIAAGASPANELPAASAAPALASASEAAPGIAGAAMHAPPETMRLLSERESRAAELAWISPMGSGLAAEPPAAPQPAPPARTAALPGRLPPPAEDSAPSPAMPPQPEAPPKRSIMAGRVARELSRKPVRFLWQTDAADRFLFVSPGLAQVVGRNAEIVGERWQDAASRLRLDPNLRIARALTQRDTWSGQTAWWPIEGSNVRVPAELTALPVFGIDHSFQGFRGFGVLRPAEALMPAAFEARFGTAEDPRPPLAEQLPPYEEAVTSAPANVVPIRADLERVADNTRLTAQERSAFEEIAAALRKRVVEEPATEEYEAAPEPDEAIEPPAILAPAEEAAEAKQGPSESGADKSEAGPHAAEPVGPAAHEAAPDETETIVPLLPAQASREDAEAAPPEDAAAIEPAKPEDAIADRDIVQRVAGPVPESLPGARDAAAEPAPAPQAARAGERGIATAMSDGEMQRRLREMTAILDTATDGVIILDATGTIESINASAEALFGMDAKEVQGTGFGDLLTPESRDLALDYLSGLQDNGVASLLNEGREVEARAGPGSIPLFMTMGRISSEEGGRFCAVLRDITHWKRTEADLVAARRAAESASGQKSEFLARVSHEIRTPLNAIIGFSEVMIEERFGPVENDRYREYLRDIRTSGEHVVSLVNDLLDISKIEAGKLDLNFVAVPLNELVRESIGLMQPQATRAHVVLRSSLSRDVPAIVADQRTLRQIVLNLLSNSVKFTGPGGQVIASTSLAASGEALLRIRDTGEGMSEDELIRALEPFRQLSTASLADRTGTGLGLPLTKALVEANRASLAIRSARGEGTVVTITFPPTRVLSE